MNYKITKCDNIDLIQVENDKSLKLVLADLGASIYKIESHNEIVNYGPKDLEDFVNPKYYYGKTIGRFAGRMKNAKWNNIQFKANEHGNLLHSGDEGLHNKRFKYYVSECANFIKISFSTTDSGYKSLFPGKFTLKVIYKIYKNIDKFEINFKSKCTEDCIVNLTNHAYFCLGAKSLSDLKMKIEASNYVAVGEHLIPTEIKEVDKVFDFRKIKKVTRDIYNKELQNSDAKGYDHLFIFDKISAKPQLFLKSDKLRLRIYTDFAAIQFYANCYPVDFVNLHGVKDDLYFAAALEPQFNTFDINNTLQKRGEERKNRIVYVFDSIKM